MEFKDQIGRVIYLKDTPKRIVSLVPSQTELLYDLNLENSVVGITKFCVHPKHWLKEKMIIGGTKKVNIEKVKSLEPDLIIGNKEENTKEDIEILEKIAPVWMSDILTFEDAYEMILSVGNLTNTIQKAENILDKIQFNFQNLKINIESKKVAYIIWDKPIMLAGKNTFINCILEKLGFENFTKEDRYPILKKNGEIDPDFVFLSSEPFPFKNEHINKFKTVFPNSKIKLINGEYFSWYGSRMLKSTIYFSKLMKELELS